MPRLSLSRLAPILMVIAACVLVALPAFADSQARIVRLSDVQGSVRIDKNSGLGFENAFLNLPITQGAELKTLDRGRAEVEFEDGSTLRIGPDTTIQFSLLGASETGKHISVINLVDGMAYVNWLGKSGDEFNLNFAHEKLTLERDAHMRIETSTEKTDIAVFKGDVEVVGPARSVEVTKNRTASFDSDDKSTITDHIAQAPLDSWDKEATAYHDQYARNNSTPYGYGASDLSYYGNYTSVPGYGMMWQPFFTGVGWDPFMDGAWSWYPGYGYMFVSPYPWGWMPYRYGNWLLVPGMGWMWQPGGFNSWTTVPHYTGVVAHPLVRPAGSVSTVVVGKGGPVSTTTLSRTLSSGSAGLGIPRGSLDNLRHLNGQVAKNGLVEVHPAPQFSASSGRTPFGESGFGQPRAGFPAPTAGSSGPAAHAPAGGAAHR
jgi:hypothetical protein